MATASLGPNLGYLLFVVVFLSYTITREVSGQEIPEYDDGSLIHCDGEPCYNGGECRWDGWSDVCYCALGFQGKNCNQSINCTQSPCQHDGVCFEEGQNDLCDCVNGFHGSVCQYTDCSRNPCRNGGSCVDLKDGITTCVCPNTINYLADAYCELAHNCGTHACANRGTCNNSTGTPTCACPYGFSGHFCHTRANCSLVPCENGGTCNFDDTRANCACPREAGVSGPFCSDIRDCDSNPCRNGGVCGVDEDGLKSYSCHCDVGFSGEQCENFNCTVTGCQNGGTCYANPFYTSCACPPNTGGTTCERIQNCTTFVCQNGGTCRPHDTEHVTCECPPAYTGHLCQSTNCSVIPCQNEGTCHVSGSYSRCLCKRYTWGATCEQKQDCNTDPCQSGGTCDKDTGDCKCPTGFSGVLCAILNCTASPCQNNGTCVTSRNFDRCQCPLGFSGYLCQVEEGCTDRTCQHGGTCLDDSTVHCQCMTGYTGETCELRESCGEDFPCHNGGSCLERSKRCMCPRIYTGYFCESYNCRATIYEPNTTACQNGGHCVPRSVSAHHCRCPAGFRGERCESAVIPGWGPWSDYNPCSKTCDYGLKTRHRSCSARPCDGNGNYTVICNTNNCQERNQEKDEGLMLEFVLSNPRALVMKEGIVLHTTAKIINDFCVDGKQDKCCASFGKGSFRKGWTGPFLQPDDVKTAKGYPTNLTAQNSALLKVLVQKTPDALLALCKGDQGTRRKRDADTVIYMSSDVMQEALEPNMDKYQELGLTAVVYQEAKDNQEAKDKKNRVPLIVGATFGALFAVLLICLAVWTSRRQLRKMKMSSSTDDLTTEETTVRYSPF